LKKHCCESMNYHVNYKCDIHDNPFDCPDNLLYFNSDEDSYGLILHDGGSAILEIAFCPWCGSGLSEKEEHHEKISNHDSRQNP
jgi:hypothetical protein